MADSPYSRPVPFPMDRVRPLQQPQGPVQPRRAPQRTQKKQRRYSGWQRWWRITIVWALIVVAILVFDFITYGLDVAQTGQSATVATYAGDISALGWIVWVLAGALLYWFNLIRHMSREAFTPVPSLEDIEAGLRAEGYNPTLQDVLAVQAHLNSERRGKQIVLGGLVIGPIILRRIARGRRPF